MWAILFSHILIYPSIRFFLILLKKKKKKNFYDSTDSLMRMRSAGILNYLEKKWISMDIYSQSNHLHWSTFQPVNYEHIHLAFFEFTVMVTISIIICILENIWYRVQVNFRKTNSNSILLGMRDDYVMNNATKACRKAGPRLFARRRKISSILSPANIKRPAFRQSVTVRMNHW